MITREQLQHPSSTPAHDLVAHVLTPAFGSGCYEPGYDTPVAGMLADITTDQLLQDGITSFIKVGTFCLFLCDLTVYDITVADSRWLQRNRVTLQRYVRQLTVGNDAALITFHYSASSERDAWRLTYAARHGGEGYTDAHRYTFLLGPDQPCRTAADRLNALADKDGTATKEDLRQAFSVEALSDEFFQRYKEHYERFVQYVTGKRFVEVKANKYEERVVGEPCEEMYAAFGHDDRRVRDYLKRTLGRIVFLHFLQRKGWLGVPAGKDWGEGDTAFMRHLFDNAPKELQADFLDRVLEPLFNLGIDTDRQPDYLYTLPTTGKPERVRVPYLNGGLFQRDQDDELPTRFPAELFRDLLDFFQQYDFTIDENDPTEAQVGVDPEMLGRIFENLLEDNKDKGAFYTPKEIVRYMCRQSLATWLSEQTGVSADDLVPFLESGTAAALPEAVDPAALHATLLQALRTVRVCDPAIGSGAFPMGMLRQLFLARTALEPDTAPATIKRDIIEHNIYGVDIEHGAVDIARLRFWLAIVVDEQRPTPLPNLDYKIMQGNSLLEQFGGVGLSHLMPAVAHKVVQQADLFNSATTYQTQLFAAEGQPELQRLTTQYYSCTDHEERRTLAETIKKTICDMLGHQGFNADILHDLAAVDPRATDRFFLWHTWFADIFQQGGFDIVIGNPPYIQLQTMAADVKTAYQRAGYEAYNSMGDIYCLFYELGLRLLCPGGVLAYITSNKWMRAGYGEPLRRLLATAARVRLLIDMNGVEVFDNATVDVNILVAQAGGVGFSPHPQRVGRSPHLQPPWPLWPTNLPTRRRSGCGTS